MVTSARRSSREARRRERRYVNHRVENRTGGEKSDTANAIRRNCARASFGQQRQSQVAKERVHSWNSLRQRKWARSESQLMRYVDLRSSRMGRVLNGAT